MVRIILCCHSKTTHVIIGQRSSLAYLLQEGELSQSDRAAGWVSYDQKWKLEQGDNIYWHYRSLFNHCDVFRHQQSNRIRSPRWKTRNKPIKVIQGHRRRYQSKARMRLPISGSIVTDILSPTVAELSQLIKILDTLLFWATLWWA